MFKTITLLSFFAASVWAAEFWETKPYTQWTESEVNKMLNGSPWSKREMFEPHMAAGRGGGDQGGGGAAPSGGGGGKGKGGGGGGGGQGGGGGNDGPNVQTATAVFQWVTALPMKQAVMKARLGAEAATSTQAKEHFERTEQFYILHVITTPQIARSFNQAKDAILAATTISVKGKTPIKATEIQIGNAGDMFISFPRTAPVTVDDKELEVDTKFAGATIKTKFKLKDMVINGKLEI